MGWTKVDTREPHVCDRPRFVGEGGISGGDVIRCDCGQHWKVVSVDHGVQWDPLPRGVLIWEKLDL